MVFPLLILGFALLGLIINIAALIVISKRKNRTIFHDLLMILTAYDICVLICCAFQFALPVLWTSYSENIHPYVMVILLPAIHISVMTSVYCTILISFERYVRICFYCQLKETNILTEDNIKYYQIAVILFPIFFYLPKFFEVRTAEILSEKSQSVNCQKYLKLERLLENPDMQAIVYNTFNDSDILKIERISKLCLEVNDTREMNSGTSINITISTSKILSIAPTSLRTNIYYYKIYYVYLNTIFASLLPLALLSFFNIRTARELYLMSSLASKNFTSLTVIEMTTTTTTNNTALALETTEVEDVKEVEAEAEEKNSFVLEEDFDSLTKFGRSLPYDYTNEFPQSINNNNNDRRKSKVSFYSDVKKGSEERGSLANRASLSSVGGTVINKRKESRLARISLCIVSLFIFCHFCKLIPTTYEALVMAKEPEEWPSWIVFVENLSHTLITLNSSLNFLIYVVL